MSCLNKYHSNLLQFKNKHKGKTAYLFGNGPTINNFKMKEDGIFISCNAIMFNDFIKKNLKYYFFGDGYHYFDIELIKPGTKYKELIGEIIMNDYTTVFCCAALEGSRRIHKYTREEITDFHNKGVFILDMTRDLENLKPDIDKNRICDHSIIFTCLHFALYCGFSKIYIVGCDCTQVETSHFYLTNKIIEKLPNNGYKRNCINFPEQKWLPNIWLKMKDFKNKYFTNTKLININPILLKGKMDGDIYT